MIEIEAAVGPRLEKMAGGAVKTALERTFLKTGLYADRTMKIEAPIDTGRLRGSIGLNRPEPLMVQIFAEAKYWGYLQYGTSKIDANPFVTRTANKTMKYIRTAFDSELKKVVG